ncbi:RidA family protein [Algicella marina]|uniref:RidA family protein n=1 Tax=Algicella marina TaxID=2683284 RepID=A0A6P1T3Z6_9RHOB|nr:RidA family protein [Algicella marina]QHQ36475.1 RidA family protein [Algicella marina]
MAGAIDAKLKSLDITLPDAPAPAANYVPYVRSGNLVFVSGQLPSGPDGLMKGKVGSETDVATAQQAARQCGIALIAQLKAACDGDLDKVQRVVKLTGFVNATPEFGDHPAVVNGASDLMAEVFGAKGSHSRAAVGAGSLPFNVSVEVEGVFEIA